MGLPQLGSHSSFLPFLSRAREFFSYTEINPIQKNLKKTFKSPYNAPLVLQIEIFAFRFASLFESNMGICRYSVTAIMGVVVKKKASPVGILSGLLQQSPAQQGFFILLASLCTNSIVETKPT